MKHALILAALLATGLGACTNTSERDDNTGAATPTATPPKMEIVETDVRYSADTTNCSSFVAYDKSKTGPRPVVLVIPEWWGLNDYPKMRARELAKLGYFALAVDMYGQRRIGQNPEQAGKLAGPFYQDSLLVRNRLEAALASLKRYPEADTTKVAMIGYCFGGSMALTGARLRLPLRGVASFHGGLKGTASHTVPELICHGEADEMVPPQEVAAWRKTMDELGADYTFRSYPGATHAFTNPGATATGKTFHLPIAYNPAADTASWQELQRFLKRIF